MNYRKTFSVMLGIGLACLAANARAEFYVAGEVGATFPQSLSEIQGTGAFSGGTLSDLGLKNSFMYGGRVGYYLPGSLKWLGFETEAFTTTPHIKAQNFTATGPGGTVSDFTEGSHFRVTTWAFNVVARYPGERFQPYVGAGVGIFWANLTDLSGSGSTDTSPGANVFAGARFFLTKQVALFGEYKFNHASFTFTENVTPFGQGGIQGDYNAHIAAGGISFHFPR